MNRRLRIAAIFALIPQLSFGHQVPLVHGSELGFSGPALCEDKTFDEWLAPVAAFQTREYSRVYEQFPDWYQRAMRGEQVKPTPVDIEVLNGFFRDRSSAIGGQVDKIFTEVKSKMALLLDACCANDQRCAAQLASTTMLTSDDLIGGGHYNSRENRIELNPGQGRITTIEEAQWLVVHELGHACQQALSMSATPTPDLDEEIQVLLNLHTRFFGSEFLNCIEKFSRDEAVRQGGLYTLSIRSYALREAFAEAVFAPLLRNSLHWQGANAWGGYKAANVCRFTIPTLKSQWCDQREVLYH